MMDTPNLTPVSTKEGLQERLNGYLKSRADLRPLRLKNMRTKGLPFCGTSLSEACKPSSPAGRSVANLLDHINVQLEKKDVYLFGGIVRETAFSGKNACCADIDVVVDGTMDEILRVLDPYNIKENKFGGYRMIVGDWPVDIWQAQDTWAFRNKLVEYEGIHSLIKTTALNWDAVLVNWNNGKMIYPHNYIESLKEGVIDIVLADNPNPLGMLVRVLRQLVTRGDYITPKASNYLVDATTEYPYEEVHKYELDKFQGAVIEESAHRLFSHDNGYIFKRLENDRDGCNIYIRDLLSGQLSLIEPIKYLAREHEQSAIHQNR